MPCGSEKLIGGSRQDRWSESATEARLWRGSGASRARLVISICTFSVRLLLFDTKHLVTEKHLNALMSSI